MSEVAVLDKQGVKDRLAGAFDVMIEQAEINPALSKLVQGFFTNFMNNTDEDKITTLLTSMRDELIPYILDGDA